MSSTAQLDQLDAEARAVADAIRSADSGAEARDHEGAASSTAEGDRAAGGGAPEAEVIRNPAPQIMAVLKMARDVPMLRALLPGACIAALDDAAIAELAEAAGDLAVKYRISLGGMLVGEWKEEIRGALALGSVAFLVWRAMHADDDAARAGRARDVSPGAPEYRDPPNAAAGAQPIEPGA